LHLETGDGFDQLRPKALLRKEGAALDVLDEFGLKARQFCDALDGERSVGSLVSDMGAEECFGLHEISLM